MSSPLMEVGRCGGVPSYLWRLYGEGTNHKLEEAGEGRRGCVGTGRLRLRYPIGMPSALPAPVKGQTLSLHPGEGLGRQAGPVVAGYLLCARPQSLLSLYFPSTLAGGMVSPILG